MEKDVEGGSHRGVRRVASRATKMQGQLERECGREKRVKEEVGEKCFGLSIKLIEGFRRFFILEMDHDYGRDYVRFGMRFEMELLGFWAMGVLLTFGEMFGSMEFSFLLPTQCLAKIAPIRPPCGEEIMDWPGWKWDEGEFSLQNQHMQPWIKCGKVLTNVERVKRHLTMDSSFHICDLGIYKCPKKVDVTFMVSAIDGEMESKCRRWPELGIRNRNGRRRDPRGIISEELKRLRQLEVQNGRQISEFAQEQEIFVVLRYRMWLQVNG
ncbi:hypothetical protein GOBAR_DD15510 [Gossypium barbadense]|nr:hypothetical protein GOBAR_DD15510 [Gossypium barbadense]